VSRFDDERDVELLLLESRPIPDPEWRGQLRRSLSTKPRQSRLQRFGLAAVAAAAVSAAFLVAGLLGGGPLSGLSNEPVTAKDNCRFVVEKVERRVPTIVDGVAGPRVEYQRRMVDRRVKRCE
jgi:hypothetical protein